jgi:hypothetical protein
MVAVVQPAAVLTRLHCRSELHLLELKMVVLTYKGNDFY